MVVMAMTPNSIIQYITQCVTMDVVIDLDPQSIVECLSIAYFHQVFPERHLVTKYENE